MTEGLTVKGIRERFKPKKSAPLPTVSLHEQMAIINAQIRGVVLAVANQDIKQDAAELLKEQVTAAQKMLRNLAGQL